VRYARNEKVRGSKRERCVRERDLRVVFLEQEKIFVIFVEFTY
jgi:hypothetical protein